MSPDVPAGGKSTSSARVRPRKVITGPLAATVGDALGVGVRVRVGVGPPTVAVRVRVGDGPETVGVIVRVRVRVGVGPVGVRVAVRVTVAVLPLLVGVRVRVIVGDDPIGAVGLAAPTVRVGVIVRVRLALGVGEAVSVTVGVGVSGRGVNVPGGGPLPVCSMRCCTGPIRPERSRICTLKRVSPFGNANSELTAQQNCARLSGETKPS